MHTPDTLHAHLRDYLRQRAPEVGFFRAVQEISDALRQLRLFGTSAKRHTMAAEAMRTSSPRIENVSKSAGPLL